MRARERNPSGGEGEREIPSGEKEREIPSGEREREQSPTGRGRERAPSLKRKRERRDCDPLEGERERNNVDGLFYLQLEIKLD